MWQQLSDNIKAWDIKSLSRAISLVENSVEGYDEFLKNLPASNTRIIGITGPPGAGKSTLVDALIGELVESGNKIAVLCVDPSSPFNLGALLGDRIRMSQWFTHPHVFIRSLANHGSMGGLNPMIIEITSVLKAAAFDYIIVETVGIGQSEVEIAGLADVTVVVLVPEAGDEIQTMKAGLMEIADIFVVNKSDRPGTDQFVKNLYQLLAPAHKRQDRGIPVIKTIATEKKGIDELAELIAKQVSAQTTEKKIYLLVRKAWQILQRQRMKGIDLKKIEQLISDKLETGDFNLFALIEEIDKKY